MYAQISSAPIEQLAHFIRNLDQSDKKRLVRLVPELKSIADEEEGVISAEQRDLIAYFDALTPHAAPSLPDDAIFIEGLTFAQFFALPEAEQATVWDTAHIKSEAILGDRAYAVLNHANSA